MIIEKLPTDKERSKRYYYHISLLFIMCLLISNFGATKLVNLFGLTLPGGIVIFPLLYVLNDTLTEVYGFTASRYVIWVAMICNLLVSGILFAITFLPPAVPWSNDEAFKNIFSLSPLVFSASIISYLIGESINATVIASLKIKMRGRFFVFRALFSTIIGAFLETTIFCIVVFYGKVETNILCSMIVDMVLIKVIYEALAMPITVRVISYLKIKEGIDVYEAPKFSLFLPTSIGN
jgi:hypothetical protein